MRRIPGLLGGLLLLSACGPSTTSHPGPSPTLRPPVSTAAIGPSVAATVQRNGGGGTGQDAVRGPGGMSLQEEIGAVMMVGFSGPVTPSVVAEWRQRQYGALLLVRSNGNAGTPAEIRSAIQRIRGAVSHTLLAATSQEGGTVCFPETGVPCLAGASQAGPQGPAAVAVQMQRMSSGLKSLGFDIDLAPVADVWDGTHPSMRDRTYGQDPQVVGQDVAAAIAGMHAAGLYAAASGESLDTMRGRDAVPLQAAAKAQAEFIMVGHMSMPADASPAAASPSTAALQKLKGDLGYHGAVISDDLSQAASPTAAAVHFLTAGGDMVIVSHDLTVAGATADAIRAAVLDGTYPRAQLDASVQTLLNLSLKFMP